MKGLENESNDFSTTVKNITAQNPKGSAAEKMILNRFLSSPMYNTQLHGKDFVNTALEWLQRIKVDLSKKFPDADLSDLEDLAHKMYEDYLARIGQLEESNLPPRAGFNKKPKQKGPGYHKDDYEYTEFVPRDKKERGEEWAIKRDVMKQKLKKSEPKSMDTGFYKSYLSNRPVREGEVVSMQARKTPLVVAGHPFDWNVYDLRTNQRVANILGGDRRERPMYEVRIRSSGMTSTKMPPTYVVTAGSDNNPPYYAYELVAPEGGFGKVEKSPGPGGTTKLRPDQDDMVRHMFKNLGGGKYYGYDLNMVEEGLDQWELVEKALGAKIMDVDTANELGYTDWDPNDSSSIVYLGNKKEKVDELRKDTINNYLSKSSAAVRGGKQERPKKVPSWKVAAGKLYPDKAMGKYAKIPASGIMQGVAETTSTGTSVGSAGIGGGSGISVEASPIVKAFQNQVDEHINTPGGMGQSYRKYEVKGPAGLEENLLNTYGDQLGLPKESAVIKGMQEAVTNWSKENPPPPELLLNTLIQILMNPMNEKSPDDLINLWNQKYGLKHTLKTLKSYAQNDYKKMELSKALMKAAGVHESLKRK